MSRPPQKTSSAVKAQITAQGKQTTPPKKATQKPITPWLGFALLVIGLDQATKWWVQSIIAPGAVIEITSFFNLVHVYNPGAAFSFLASESGWQKHFLSAVAMVASLVILWLMRSSRNRPFAMVCLAMILGGAIGNLIDRLIHGAVVDFLDVYYQHYHWPAFNVADMGISCGAIGLIIEEIFFHKPNNEAKA